MSNLINRPTLAFIGASWLAVVIGAVGFMIGLWNASIPLHEKGFYLVILLYGLFSAVSLQKTLRDKLEDIPVTAIYVALCWTSVCICIGLLLFSLSNATLSLSEKGYYIMSFLLSLFGVTATQKNIRDLEHLHLQTELNPRQLKLEKTTQQSEPFE
ncbi:UNVERIFIED_CONTAM: yiaA [Trichonephila clavipes]